MGKKSRITSSVRKKVKNKIYTRKSSARKTQTADRDQKMLATAASSSSLSEEDAECGKWLLYAGKNRGEGYI